MKVFVINCGSSSLKYQLIDMTDEHVMAKGLVERIGIDGSRVKHTTTGKESVVIEKPLETHKEALEVVMAALTDEKSGAIKDVSEINAVGHRVVHGGEKFADSVRIDDKVMAAIKECVELAPLHNPANIIGIEACEALMPGVPMVAVFDTAFHQTMPKCAYVYALPYEYYKDYGVRRYGMHGTSHRYVSKQAANLLGAKLEDLKIITCHLGNGASVSAVKNGHSVDTSMGFTPLEGLIMGTRCGDLDPAVITFIMEKEKLDVNQMNDVMNKKSGVLGISGVSSDFRDIEEAAAEGNKRAALALESFSYRVKKYIGAYAAVMGGVDAIVFTAGLGENSPETRMSICEGLEFLGVEVDAAENNVRGKDKIVSTPNSKVKVLVVPTEEELTIARDTMELL